MAKTKLTLEEARSLLTKAQGELRAQERDLSEKAAGLRAVKEFIAEECEASEKDFASGKWEAKLDARIEEVDAGVAKLEGSIEAAIKDAESALEEATA